jgi:hypothetical protein
MSQESFDDQDEGEEHEDEGHENEENDEEEYQDQDQDELSTCRFLTYSVVGIICGYGFHVLFKWHYDMI